jgi:hypothetical protein
MCLFFSQWACVTLGCHKNEVNAQNEKFDTSVRGPAEQACEILKKTILRRETRK